MNIQRRYFKMIFKRKIYDELLEWNKKDVKSSAILIEGARRIGKTTVVKEFADNNYADNYIYIDFKIASDSLKETTRRFRASVPVSSAIAATAIATISALVSSSIITSENYYNGILPCFLYGRS